MQEEGKAFVPRALSSALSRTRKTFTPILFRRSFPRRRERRSAVRPTPGLRAVRVPLYALQGGSCRQQIIVVPVIVHSPGRGSPFYVRRFDVKLRDLFGVHLLPLVVARRERLVLGEVEIPFFLGRVLHLPHLVLEVPGELFAIHGAEEISADRRSGGVRLPRVHPLQRGTSIGDAHF